MGLPAVVAGAVDRDPSDAHAVCRLSRAALDVVEDLLARRRRAGRAGDGMGPGVACPRTRGSARLHGRRAEVGAGRRRGVAAADRVLCCRTDLGGDCSRAAFSTAAGRNRRFGVPGAILLSSLAWTALHCSMTGSSSARFSRSACCSAICATAPNSTLADDRPARPQQSRRDGADHLAGGFELSDFDERSSSPLPTGERSNCAAIRVRGMAHRWSATPHTALRADLSQWER